MALFKFGELSYDLKAMVISYVTRPTDMKHLCLVNKELRDITVPQLYRRVELDIGGQADLKLSAFLGRDNPGLEHIRSLILNPDADSFPPSSPQRSSPPPTPPQQQQPPPPQPPGVNIITVPGGQQGFGGPPPPLPYPAPGPPNVVVQSRSRSAERKLPRYSPAHFTTKLLLDLLPANILEKYRWTSYDEYDVENFVLLLKRQKKLKCIEVGPTTSSLLEALEQNPEAMKGLNQLHALDIYPDNLDCLKACRLMMKNCPKLDELWLESACEPSSNGDDQNFEDESGRPGLITSTLFEDKVPFQACTNPMSLKYLALIKVNLRWAAQTYMRAISFPGLEELEIRECPGADALLAELTKPAKHPDKLEHLIFSQQTDDGHGYALSALEGFLRSLTTLQRLYINLVGPTLPKIDAICQQGEKLTVLVVHSSFTAGHFDPQQQRVVYAASDVEKLGRECPKLQQLALGCPHSHLLEISCSEEHYRFMDALMTFRNLITLNFTTWPDIAPIYTHRGNNARLPSPIFTHNFQRLAQVTFGLHEEAGNPQSPPAPSSDPSSSTDTPSTTVNTPSKLTVLAYGAKTKNFGQPDISGKSRPLIFTRGKRIDAFGQESPLAVRIKAPAVKFVEPWSDVLDYSFPDPLEPRLP